MIEVLWTSGAEVIEHDNLIFFFKQCVNQMTADETSAAGNEDGFVS
jgi:hypothetical protein